MRPTAPRTHTPLPRTQDRLLAYSNGVPSPISLSREPCLAGFFSPRGDSSTVSAQGPSNAFIPTDL